MKNRSFFLSVLTVGLALGTAWAVRGRFGHEQGAAWAGAIGALSLILVAKRTDWYRKAFHVVMAAAVGWGISGVMSYGVVVGYGRGTDFPNVFYGLLMLFVIGILYGFLGGGLVGLALLHSKNLKVKWHSLVAEMVAFGLLTYSVLVGQLGWLMTPPRSEMWAGCLGASVALAWYIVRNALPAAMKVAVCSALGAGFGFAFGNFLQVLGAASGWEFNFWNVMEYSIGFFGGIGMAYGTFTSPWPPAAEDSPSPNANLVPILFVALFIPFVVWDQSFVTDRFDFVLESGGSLSTILYFKLVALVSILAVFGLTIWRNYSSIRQTVAARSQGSIKQFFVLYASLYIFLSFLVTGIFVHPVEQYLYIANLLLIIFLISQTSAQFSVHPNRPLTWLTLSVVSIAIIAVLAFIAINSHDGLQGSQIRFGKTL
jgi:hypothetical protein